MILTFDSYFMISICRVWDPSSISLHTKSVAKYNIDLLSMDWVHHGSSDNLVSILRY